MILKDVSVGSIDAKNEIINHDEDVFMESFIQLDNINIEDFCNGRKYYITGMKGTGKTALLRYISILFNGQGYFSEFFLFKSELGRDQLDDLNNLAYQISHQEANNVDNFIYVWRWFLLKRIYDIIEKNKNVVERNEFWWKFKEIIHTPASKKGIKSIFPILKNGNIKIEGGLPSFIKASFSADIKGKNEKFISFRIIVEEAIDLLTKLKINDNKRIFIFLDELDISLKSKKDFKKDSEIVRDLIITVNYMNNLFRENGLEIFLIAAIRSEVLTSIYTIGEEINKIISDFGSKLRWDYPSENTPLLEHPLLKIITRRFQFSEKKVERISSSDEEIWKKYFPLKIDEKSIQSYLLNRTWFKPRDIIRILKVLKERYPNTSRVEQYQLENTMKEYSIESWNELKEELTVRYTANEIKCIEEILTSIPKSFSLDNIRGRIERLKHDNSDMERFIKTQSDISNMLSILYKIGIIGNCNEHDGRKILRFAHRGDDNLNLQMDMLVHYSLRPKFSIT